MKLIDIPVFFICPSHNEKYKLREKHMYELLQQIGFTTITHFKSTTDEYPTCLVKATTDILNQCMNDEPVIILEDDIEMYTSLDSTTHIDLPENTDAFYLGFSKDGGSKTRNSHEGPSIVGKISATHIKIFNMLSAHAILYKSKRYKERVVDALNKIVDKKGYYNDVILSRLQYDYNIYGYYYPFFYQSVNYDNVIETEKQTRFHY
jgi:hypothetical protein